ncbi:MAG: helix-turn-helix domain-containing protein [Clostridia bacterium]|nr:helix-turn-helix domain-containing protein [Clostridia bacterium]
MEKLNQTYAGGRLLSKLMDCAFKCAPDCITGEYDPQNYRKAFNDKDLVETCFCLFENDLNVSRTAGKLYMHRNTLIYRIAKLKRLTGLDVCKFSDAVTFIILYRCYCGEGVK